jgi:cell division protein FtsL
MMIQEQTAWNPRLAAAPPRARRTYSPTFPIEIHPLRLILSYRLASATVLMSMAVLMYLLQVNQGAWIDFRLEQAGSQATQLNARLAQLLAERDRLMAASRIDTVAATRLHMQQPSLNSAVWLTVRLPRDIPTPSHEPQVRTGPLEWLRRAIVEIRDNL